MPRPAARTRDWLFGSAAKRLLIRALLVEPDRLWSKSALARAIGVHPKGGVDEHLAVLSQIGLVDGSRGKWTLRRDCPLIEPLKRLLAAVERIPDEKIERR